MTTLSAYQRAYSTMLFNAHSCPCVVREAALSACSAAINAGDATEATFGAFDALADVKRWAAPKKWLAATMGSKR